MTLTHLLSSLLCFIVAAIIPLAESGVVMSHDANKEDEQIITKRVGVVLANGFEMLDAMGPYEALKEVEEHYYSHVDIEQRIFGRGTGIRCGKDGNLVEVRVAFAAFVDEKNNHNGSDHEESGDGGIKDTKATVVSSSGVPIGVEFNLRDDPNATRFDLLVLGAGLDSSLPGVADYALRHHANGGSLMTVCTGASIPAALGLLNEKDATTNTLFLREFRKAWPRVRWIDLADNLQRRFVRSTPQIVTTAGITAGIDGILDRIREWCGGDVAEATRQCLEWPLRIEEEEVDGEEEELRWKKRRD